MWLLVVAALLGKIDGIVRVQISRVMTIGLLLGLLLCGSSSSSSSSRSKLDYVVA